MNDGIETRNKHFFTEEYFDEIFHSFKETIWKERKALPSVSLIALEYKNDPFAILVSTLISLRTKDEVTIKASERLLEVAPDVYSMSNMEKEKIESLIYPCAFFKRKAVQLRDISNELIVRFDGKVPSSQAELLSLKGVGIKTANLVLNLGFEIDAICVDCHVHQISNRLGWIRTKTAEESVVELEKLMPRKYWIPLNELLVAYGQSICTPISPFCSKCPKNEECPKIGVEKSR
ncbi:MAG: endonuclease III [Sphaerochaetaceae bacterium]|nr:endonuclease III [Sphaerochaetaceae bacterium]